MSEPAYIPCDTCGADCLNADTPDAYDIECQECGWTFYVPAEASARSRIGKLRQINRSGMAARVEGYLVDIQTASLLVKVYEALSPENREKFGKPSLPRLVELGWKCASPA